jgi:hypothetical protein
MVDNFGTLITERTWPVVLQAMPLKPVRCPTSIVKHEPHEEFEFPWCLGSPDLLRTKKAGLAQIESNIRRSR